MWRKEDRLRYEACQDEKLFTWFCVGCLVLAAVGTWLTHESPTTLPERCAAIARAYPATETELVTGPNGATVCQVRDAGGRLTRAIREEDRP